MKGHTAAVQHKDLLMDHLNFTWKHFYSDGSGLFLNGYFMEFHSFLTMKMMSIPSVEFHRLSQAMIRYMQEVLVDCNNPTKAFFPPINVFFYECFALQLG